MKLAARNCVLGHMRAVKIQISQPNRLVQGGLSLCVYVSCII